MQGALAAQGSHPCASLLLRNTGKWLVGAEEEHPGAPTGVLGQDAWGEDTGQRSKEHPECPLRPHAGGRLASHAAGAGNGAHPSRRARCLPHRAWPKRSGLGGPRCGAGGGAAFQSLCSRVLGAPWARAAGFTHCLRRSGKRGTWAIRSRLEVGDWILAKRPLEATGRGGRHLGDPLGCGLRALCGPTAPQQEVCTGQRPRPPLCPHSDTLGTWGPEAVGRGQALTGGPAVPTTYPWRPQCHLPSQHSPPHPQSHSPAGHPWGCHQQGTARPAAAHPPGMPLLQGCALGFCRVLDHSSGLPREVHGHQGVLRHTALEGQSHERVKPSDQAAAAAGHLGAKRKAFLCRT